MGRYVSRLSPSPGKPPARRLAQLVQTEKWPRCIPWWLHTGSGATPTLNSEGADVADRTRSFREQHSTTGHSSVTTPLMRPASTRVEPSTR